MQSKAWKYGLRSQSTLRAPPVPESEREGVQHMDGYPSVFDIVRPQRSLASLASKTCHLTEGIPSSQGLTQR